MSQYALPLTLPPVFSDDNFYVSDCNRQAHQWIMAWPNWPAHALLLHGPKGSGKSHLGLIWAGRAKASVTAASAINAGEMAGKNWLIEELGQLRDERQLLHLFNASREQGGSLLLTSSQPAPQLPFTLPDLTSRLLALPAASIDQPDDAVLAAALRKQFADRQMKVADEVIEYLLPRIERSLVYVSKIVELLDKEALAGQKTMTVPFVRQWLSDAAR